jgi:uncharacterized protein YjbI with pentapeptide repeats
MFYGKLGTAGFLTILIGMVTFPTFLGAQEIHNLLFPVPGPTPGPPYYQTITQIMLVVPYALGVLGTLVGIVLLGIATLRARVLPRWCGAALIGVLPVSVALHYWVIPVGGLAFGLVWLALGYVLWSHRGAEPRWRPPERGILWIVGIFAVLAVVQLAVQLAAYLEQLGLILVTVGVAAVLTVVIALARIGYRYQWTGFGEEVRPETDAHDVRRAKTLWDWLALLIIPVVLAVGGLWFSLAQDARQQETDDQRARDAALQSYLDEIGELLLDKKLQPENLDDEARTLARARTLTILQRLNPGPTEGASPLGPPSLGGQSLGSDRRRSVLQFLYEANLISKGNVVVDLAGSDLSDANLGGIVFSSANLSGSNLRHAHLIRAKLSNAELSTTNLREADLQGADLSDANLTGADLIGASLGGANLIGADLSDANLTSADLRPSWTTPGVDPKEVMVTQEQVNQAWGDESTELPDDLELPESWSNEARKAKIKTTKTKPG